MAGSSDVNPGIRIVILFLLVIVLALGGTIWFDYLGLIDAKSMLSPVLRLLGRSPRTTSVNADDPNLLDKERLAKSADALALQSEDLSKKEKALDGKEKELTQLAQDLGDKEKAVEEREKAFNEREKAFENRRVNLAQNATYLTGMTPANAVKIMENMEDQDVIDIFRITEENAAKAGEESTVALWLSMFKPDRAAAIQRKMARKTGG
jgi:flagellar protein FlbB